MNESDAGGTRSPWRCARCKREIDGPSDIDVALGVSALCLECVAHGPGAEPVVRCARCGNKIVAADGSVSSLAGEPICSSCEKAAATDPPGPLGGRSSQSSPPPVREDADPSGDWRCPRCGARAAPSRAGGADPPECAACGEQKPSVPTRGGAAEGTTKGRSDVASPGRPRAGPLNRPRSVATAAVTVRSFGVSPASAVAPRTPAYRSPVVLAALLLLAVALVTRRGLREASAEVLPVDALEGRIVRSRAVTPGDREPAPVSQDPLPAEVVTNEAGFATVVAGPGPVETLRMMCDDPQFAGWLHPVAIVPTAPPGPGVWIGVVQYFDGGIRHASVPIRRDAVDGRWKIGDGQGPIALGDPPPEYDGQAPPP